jgi:hypothetical protein
MSRRPISIRSITMADVKHARRHVPSLAAIIPETRTRICSRRRITWPGKRVDPTQHRII